VPGDYWWFASYGGDPGNNATDSGCGTAMAETVVRKATPSPGAAKVTVGRVTVSGTTANIPLECHGTSRQRCDTTLTLATTDPAKSLHMVTVGSATARLIGGHTQTIRLGLNSKGKQLLAKRHRLETKLIVRQSGLVVARETVTFHRTG
jgi:hypothetical protein